MTTTWTRSSFRDGRRAVIAVQKENTKRLDRQLIRPVVEGIIQTVGLVGTNQERYFRLWATCALLGLESRYQYWRKK